MTPYLMNATLEGRPPFRKAGELLPVPEGVRLVSEGMVERRGLDFPTTVKFVVEPIDALATGQFGAWLYDKLQNRAQRLRADGQDIELSPEAVRRIVEKHVQKLRRSRSNKPAAPGARSI
jgi:hypothetical protein